MIVYNVTSILDKEIESDYIAFMQEIHMPEVMATGMFTDCNLYLVTEPENEGATYCAQYITDDIEKLERYKADYAPQLKVHFQEKFENRFVAVRSVLQLISPKK